MTELNTPLMPDIPWYRSDDPEGWKNNLKNEPIGEREGLEVEQVLIKERIHQWRDLRDLCDMMLTLEASRLRINKAKHARLADEINGRVHNGI